MARMELAVRLNDDRQHVRVELRQDGEPVGHILLAPSDAEHHMQAVAEKRGMLTEPVPNELDPGARLWTTIDPVWRTSIEHLEEDGAMLMLRHPGYGWLSFLLPHGSASQLGQWLVDNSTPSGNQINENPQR